MYIQQGIIRSYYIVRSYMECLANTQKCFNAHIYRSSLYICICPVRQACTFCNFGLSQPYSFSFAQHFIPNSVKVKNKHFSSSNFVLLGIMLPIFVDK